MHSDKI